MTDVQAGVSIMVRRRPCCCHGAAESWASAALANRCGEAVHQLCSANGELLTPPFQRPSNHPTLQVSSEPTEPVLYSRSVTTPSAPRLGLAVILKRSGMFPIAIIITTL